MTQVEIQAQIAALEAKVAELKRQRTDRQLETAKSYADAFIRKLEVDGIPIKVGLRAVRDLVRVSKGA